MISLGVIGANPGNGHPFSFSAIVNGYSSELLRESGWAVIADYLDPQLNGGAADLPARVTHAWMPDNLLTDALVRATHIVHSCSRPEEMVTAVDSVMILRDDWDTHLELATPFFEAGIPVFVDKPITLLDSELSIFEEHSEKGLVMSCSGLRFSEAHEELGPLLEMFGGCRRVTATVPGTVERYGIHILEFLLSAGALGSIHDIYAGHTDGENYYSFSTYDNQDVNIKCVPGASTPIRIHIEWQEAEWRYDFTSHYISFRETIRHFLNQVSSREPAVPWEETRQLMRNLETLQTGTSSRK